MSQTVIKKCGRDFKLIFPPDVVEAVGLQEGQQVEVIAINGVLKICPIKDPQAH